MYTYPTLKNTKYISNIDITEDQINSNTVIEGEFSIPLSIMTIKSRQKINKKTADLPLSSIFSARPWAASGQAQSFTHPTFIQQASTEHLLCARLHDGCCMASHPCGVPGSGLGFIKDASGFLAERHGW